MRWNFDGQVRHRIYDPELRKKATVVDRAKRKEAAGRTTDFRDDKLITYLTENAEEIFEPKRILSGGDWLKSFREPDQFYSKYAMSNNGSHKWISPGANKLYLFMMDNKFKETDINVYKKYAAAFFPGAEADVLREGA